MGKKELRRRRRGEAGKGESYPWDDLPLGQYPDAAIALVVGCHPRTVKKARVRRGIKGWCRPPLWQQANAVQQELDGAAGFVG